MGRKKRVNLLLKRDPSSGVMLNMDKKLLLRLNVVNYLIDKLSVALCVLLMFSIIIAADQCEDKSSEFGFALISHAYSFTFVPEYPMCLDMCINDPRCFSLNFDLSSGKCEFNYADKAFVLRFVSSSFFQETPLSIFSDIVGRGITGSQGKSCGEIKANFSSAPDGMYLIQPNSDSSMFPAYCDMTSFGGGWTMCYTTDDKVIPKTEVTYNATLPYGTNGYRTDCNNVEFREIMFVDESTGQKAFFTYQLSSTLVTAENYGTPLPALWIGGGVATKAYEYQLLICDHSFYSGFFISGYTSCVKTCTYWCIDYKSSSFRSSSTSSSYAGIAFNANRTHPNKPSRRPMSVGLR